MLRYILSAPIMALKEYPGEDSRFVELPAGTVLEFDNPEKWIGLTEAAYEGSTILVLLRDIYEAGERINTQSVN